MAYTLGTLFSGIGVPDLAAELLGIRTVWQVEKDLYAQQVLRQHFPDAALYGDIFDVSGLPSVDILAAGFPCQPFSLAGKRLGERDERYLVPEMFRVLQEVQPRVALFENVPGFASIAAGDTFRDFLRALAEMGYAAEWGHLAAADFGAPHRRERWWCVAYAEGECYPGQPGQRANRQRAACSGTEQLRAGLADGGRALGHAHGTGRREQRRAVAIRAQQPAAERAGGRAAQPRLGGSADGLADWLDSFDWPAGPDAPQKHWEPPRVVSGSVPFRAARLKALGNSMAFPVVYAIMANIRAALEAEDTALEAAGD